jgi:succinate dehydrogenase / fumarate reductase cytochrome b subunit
MEKKSMNSPIQTRKRPIFINLLQIRFPVMAVVSVGHRAAGVLLALLIPALLWLLQKTATPQGYSDALEFLRQGWVKLALFVVIWALAHHFFAGLRYLLLDLEIGLSRPQARQSAWIVHACAGATALIAGGMLL